ncbi:hypothetical protein [Paraburkholderia tagetis]|uniref:hypothetical protein n=1 Tax=Paraburkholderia tagetis TaxID=2913261 RepID=UPI001EE478FF|nr:hypothetical protein [Paraburkholderia tagetis]
MANGLANKKSLSLTKNRTIVLLVVPPASRRLDGAMAQSLDDAGQAAIIIHESSIRDRFWGNGLA